MTSDTQLHDLLQCPYSVCKSDNEAADTAEA